MTGLTLYAGEEVKPPPSPGHNPLGHNPIFCCCRTSWAEPGGYFCRKLTLNRTSYPIWPMRWGPDPNRPTNSSKQGGLWSRGVCPGGGVGRIPPETIGDGRTEFNRILCTSKSEAAVTGNKKLRCRYVEVDYRQTRSIARTLYDSWASCYNKLSVEDFCEILHGEVGYCGNGAHMT